MPVEKIVEVFVDVPCERIVEKIVEVPVERVVIKEVPPYTQDPDKEGERVNKSDSVREGETGATGAYKYMCYIYKASHV